MHQEIFLMNLRIPPYLKSPFEESCSFMRTKMTAETKRMSRDFVKGTRKDNQEPIAFHGGQDDI